jgi:hypothetical protein
MSSRNFLVKTAVFAAGLALIPAIASADHDHRRRTEVTVDPYAPVTSEDSAPKSRIGVGVSAGGGVMGFTDSQLNDQTDPGGNWQARLTLGTRSLIALEGAYIGTANNVDGLGLDQGSVMRAHGAEALLRLNFGTAAIQPYLFAGGAWKHYALLFNDNATASVANSDNVAETPLGAGIAFRASSFLFDTRFDYRPAFDEDMFASIDNEEVDLDNWNASARIGFEF